MVGLCTITKSGNSNNVQRRGRMCHESHNTSLYTTIKRKRLQLLHGLRCPLGYKTLPKLLSSVMLPYPRRTTGLSPRPTETFMAETSLHRSPIIQSHPGASSLSQLVATVTCIVIASDACIRFQRRLLNLFFIILKIFSNIPL